MLFPDLTFYTEIGEELFLCAFGATEYKSFDES